MKRRVKNTGENGQSDAELNEVANTMHCHQQSAPVVHHRLLELAPSGAWAAAALGKTLRVVNAGSGNLVELDPQSCHQEDIQVLSCSPDGCYLLSGANDKLAKVWCTKTWNCIRTVSAPKKISAGCFSRDSKHFFVADRFGDVHVAAVDGDDGPAPFFGHYCAIVTTLTIDDSGRWLASTDRDGKVRINAVPQQLLKGFSEIEAYCLGHSACVTCAHFLSHSGRALLVSGGADGKLIAWDFRTGEMAASLQVTEPPGGGAPPQHGKAADLTDAAARADEAPAPPESSSEKREASEAPAATVGEGAEGKDRPSEGALDGDKAAAANNNTPADAADAEAAAGDDRAAGEGDAEGGGEDAEESDRPPAVVAMAVDSQHALIALAIEGDDRVTVVGVSEVEGGGIQLDVRGQHCVGNVMLPSRVAFHNDGLLWAVGGPCSAGATSFHAGCCKLTDDGRSATQLPLPGVFDKLDARVAEEDSHASSDANRATQMNAKLRKKVYKPEDARVSKKRRTEEPQQGGKAKA